MATAAAPWEAESGETTRNRVAGAPLPCQNPAVLLFQVELVFFIFKAEAAI